MTDDAVFVPETSLERDINELLNDVLEKKPSEAVAPFRQLIPKAMQFVLAEPGIEKRPDSEPEQSLFRSHQLCQRCETDRVDDNGRRQEKAFRFRLQVCMLQVFTFSARRSIEFWWQGLAKTFLGCTDCYQGFLRAKREMELQLLAKYPKANVDTFTAHILQWEKEVTRKELVRIGLFDDEASSRTPRAQQAAPLMYAALELAGTLASRGDDQGLYAELRGRRAALLPASLPEMPSGLIAMAADSDAGVRAWAQSLAAIVPVRSRVMATTTPTVGLLMRRAIEQGRWDGFAFALQMSPETFTGSALPNTLLAHLSDRASQTASILSCVQNLLERKGSELWDQEDRLYPLVVLSTILDSKHYMACMFDTSDASADLFSWIAPFVKSLIPVHRHADAAPHGGEKAPATISSHDVKVYEEATKRLAYFLFEKVQQGNIPVATRLGAMLQGVTVLRDCVQLSRQPQRENDNGEEAEAEAQRAKIILVILHQVVALHSNAIATFAFRGKIPNSADSVAESHKARVLAREIIDAMFQQDCDTLSYALLTFSDSVTRHHRAYKRATRDLQQAKHLASQDKSLGGSSSKVDLDMEEKKAIGAMFTQAAVDLDCDVNVCIELWKDSYSVCQPAVDIDTFLRPLSKLSPYVEPQIKSCIVAAKEQHTSLSAYTTYKERLKAALLGFSRRLRAMRGSLHLRLLDLSDLPISMSQAKASLDLPAVCYKVTAGLIAANLSAEAEVHRAAQSVVRAAFEDAEDRADCFRSLLQCNPLGALGSIHSFLDEFVTAASVLIEANEAAKWMVRSFSDIMEVLCDDIDGILRTGTPFSLVDDVKSFQQLRPHVLAIWELMCQSIAIIYKRTPSWSRVLPSAELTAWFRDVTLFATLVVEQVGVFKHAAGVGMSVDDADDVRTSRQHISAQLAWPLEGALSWFRIDNREIVQETRDYFVKGLETFRDDEDTNDLPSSVKDHMISFIESQSQVQNDKDRMTLLSLSELSELRLLLDPHRVSSAATSDSETDKEESRSVKTTSTTAESGATPSRASSSTSLSTMAAKADKTISNVAAPARSTPSSTQDKVRLKQSKLNFDRIDAQTAQKKPFTAPVPPQPRTLAGAGAVNRYQGASARPATSSTGSASAAAARISAPATRLGQLKQGFRATHTVWKPNNPQRKFANPYGRDLPEPQAPAAKRSFIGAGPAQGAQANRQKPIEVESDDDGSSSSGSSGDEDEDGQRGGLAGLTGKKSPAKMRTKVRTIGVQQMPQRRAIMLEDQAALLAKRQREEAERKRRLREAPNFGPLHKSVLSWDYFGEGDVPAGMSKPYAVKPTYASADDYATVFEPMLLLECWADVQAAREQVERRSANHLPRSATINGRTNTDAFDTLAVQLPPERASADSSWFQDTDVVYVREVAATSGGTGRQRTILGKVDAYKFHPRGSRLTIRCRLSSTSAQGLSSVFVAGAEVEIGKLISLTTVHRAYAALRALRYYDMLPSILQAKSAAKENITESDMTAAQDAFGVNAPQATALLGAIKSPHGIQLIQGPPGTGKTKTICSLVAHFLRTRKAPAAPIHPGRSSNNVGVIATAVKRKILLCAPSNAAVDEVAKRVQMMSICLADGQTVKPNVVRLGREDAMNITVKHFSLDAIVQQRLATMSASAQQQNGQTSDPTQLHADIRALKDRLDTKRAEVEDARHKGLAAKVIDQLDAEARNLASKRMDMMSKLDSVKDARQAVSRQNDADRKRAQHDVLIQADVVCTTLGGAGHPMLADLPFDFETVVIDEAAQAVELDCLIPLRYGCQRCILVGDPNQLPPTVISREAERLQYSQSLFVRLFNNPHGHTHLLSIQYRMHPFISRFPSDAFYDGKLQDGPNMISLTEKPWHGDHLLRPLRFFDCRHSAEQSGRGGHSMINRAEADMAVAIYERLRRHETRRGGGFAGALDGKVGVVTMYKDQVFELKRAFERVYGKGIEEAVDFNTVDGFQGQEKDVIILSCVRSNGIGFLTDFRRINVAITRAKSNLFIIANVDNLQRHDRMGFWKQFIELARNGNDLLTVTNESFREPSNASSALPLPSTTVNRITEISDGASSNAKAKRPAAEQLAPSAPRAMMQGEQRPPSGPRAMMQASHLPPRTADRTGHPPTRPGGQANTSLARPVGPSSHTTVRSFGPTGSDRTASTSSIKRPHDSEESGNTPGSTATTPPNKVQKLGSAPSSFKHQGPRPPRPPGPPPSRPVSRPMGVPIPTPGQNAAASAGRSRPRPFTGNGSTSAHGRPATAARPAGVPLRTGRPTPIAIPGQPVQPSGPSPQSTASAFLPRPKPKPSKHRRFG